MFKTFLKTALLGSMLFLGAQRSNAQISIGVQIGAPPPPRAVVVMPAQPTPEYAWVEGYWFPVEGHYRWHEGYWTRPPYAGAHWVAPRHDGHHYYAGYWEGEHGRVEHEHKWDHDHDRRDHDHDHDHGHDHDHDRDHDRR